MCIVAYSAQPCLILAHIRSTPLRPSPRAPSHLPRPPPSSCEPPPPQPTVAPGLRGVRPRRRSYRCRTAAPSAAVRMGPVWEVLPPAPVKAHASSNTTTLAWAMLAPATTYKTRAALRPNNLPFFAPTCHAAGSSLLRRGFPPRSGPHPRSASHHCWHRPGQPFRATTLPARGQLGPPPARAGRAAPAAPGVWHTSTWIATARRTCGAENKSVDCTAATHRGLTSAGARQVTPHMRPCVEPLPPLRRPACLQGTQPMCISMCAPWP